MRHWRSRMLSTRDPGPPDGMNRADYWARRMADGEDAVTDAERAEFRAWLAESAENELRLSIAPWCCCQLMAGACRRPVRTRSSRPHRRGVRRATASPAAATSSSTQAVAARAAVALVDRRRSISRTRRLFGESHATGTGETRTVQFSEGSVAYLNTRTQLRWLGARRGSSRRAGERRSAVRRRARRERIRSP